MKRGGKRRGPGHGVGSGSSRSGTASSSASLRKFTVEELVQKAENALTTFEPGLAAKFFRRALDQDANNAQLWEDYGAALFEEGKDIDEAVKAFTKSIEIDPQGSYEKYMYLGQLLQGMDAVQLFDLGRSVLEAKYNEAVASNAPNVAELRAKLCSALCSLTEMFLTDLCDEPDAEQRCEHYMEVARTIDSPESPNPEVWQTTASVRLSQCKVEEAGAAVDKAVAAIGLMTEESRPSYEFLVSTGKLLMELQRFQEASEWFEKLLLIDNQEFDSWYYLGLCLDQSKDGVAVHESLRRAKKILAKQADKDEDEVRVLTDHIDSILAKYPDVEWEDDEEDEEMDNEKLTALFRVINNNNAAAAAGAGAGAGGDVGDDEDMEVDDEEPR